MKALCSDYVEATCTRNTAGAKCYWYNPGGAVTAACI
jgi:hypothetical protein